MPQRFQAFNNQESQGQNRKSMLGKKEKNTKRNGELQPGLIDSPETFSEISSLDCEGKGEEEEETQQEREGEAECWQAGGKDALKLDEDFDRMITAVKAHVLKLSQISDRRKCAAWIRKLRSSRALAAEKKKRNVYCGKLLRMLEAGSLQDPFHTVPDHGGLSSLHSHTMANHIHQTEAKYQEKIERLKQDQEDQLQKIWAQKNREVENVKSDQLNRIHTMEATVRKLEKKVQTLSTNLDWVQQSKDRQILELQGDSSSTDNQRSVFEQMIEDLEESFMEERRQLETEHAEELGQLIQDTSTRLQRLEDDYALKADESRVRVESLERQTEDLTGQADHAQSLCSQLQHHKQHVQQPQLVSLAARLHTLRRRHGHLQKKQRRRLKSLDRKTRALSSDADVYLDLLTRQHSTAAAKAAETMAELQRRVSGLRKTIADAEQDWSRQVREKELAHQEAKDRLTQRHMEQMDSIKSYAAKLQSQMTTNPSRLEQRLREKDDELQRQRVINKEQVKAAAQVQKDFQSQAEEQQNRRIASLQQQLEEMEAEVIRSNQAIDEDRKDFAKQLEAEKLRHQREVREARQQRASDKARLFKEAEAALTQTRAEREGVLETRRQHYQAEVRALHGRLQQRQDSALKVVEALRTEVSELTEETEDGERRREEDVRELLQVREEERLRVQQEHRDEIAEYRLEMELQCLELQKTHWTEMGEMLERLHEILSNDKLVSAEKALHNTDLSSQERDISIPSLNSRVNLLQQKADMLQDELTLPIRLSLDWI
ncbi:uncharacterized protein LOC143288305 [Babylonia areolata]|uniref:uncharacterized protein LOC143288305 n=1 Tax=Babylonia areolata TaxID=304850 RepID=UPI003FD20EFF